MVIIKHLPKQNMYYLCEVSDSSFDRHQEASRLKSLLQDPTK